MEDPNQGLNLPRADPAKKRVALERVAGQLLAAMHATSKTLKTKESMLALLKAQTIKIQTKWGWAQAQEFASVLAAEKEWTLGGVARWLNSYTSRRVAWERKKGREFEDCLAKYLSELFTQEVESFDSLLDELRVESRSPLSPQVIFSEGPTFTPTVALRHLEGIVRRGDAEAQRRLLDWTNRQIRHASWLEELRKELEGCLQEATDKFGVNVNVRELENFAGKLWSIKLYIGNSGYLLDYEGNFESLKRTLAEDAAEEAKNYTMNRREVRFAGLSWGLDEDRIFTLVIGQENSDEERLPDSTELHVHVKDEEKAFRRLKAFLNAWEVKQLMVEELSGVQSIKDRLDGPIAAESSAWKTKLEASARLQQKLDDLGVDITVVGSTPDTYMRCAHCGELLSRDVRMGHDHNSGI
jgi:hypothetical protein